MPSSQTVTWIHSLTTVLPNTISTPLKPSTLHVSSLSTRSETLFVIGYRSNGFLLYLKKQIAVGAAADLDSISETDPRELVVTKEAIVAALRRFTHVYNSEDSEEDDSIEEEPFKLLN